MWYCTVSKFVKRVYLMLSVLMTKQTSKKKLTKMGHREIFESDEYIYYLDCGESYTNIYICPNSPSYIY